MQRSTQASAEDDQLPEDLRIGVLESEHDTKWYPYKYFSGKPEVIWEYGEGHAEEQDAVNDAVQWAMIDNLPCDYTTETNRKLTESFVNEKTTKQMSVSTKAPTPISKVLDFDEISDGDAIHCISGVITGIFNTRTSPETGEDGTPKWEYQDAKLKDGDKEIKLCFSKCSQPKSARGKKVTIRAFKSEKHGWGGITVKDGEYQGKPTRELRITPTAQIEYEGGAPAEDKPASQGQDKSRTGGSPGPTTSTAHPHVALADINAFHSKCWTLVNERFGGDSKLKPEHMIALAAQLFIEGNRQGLAIDYIARSSKPLPVKTQEPPSDPKGWRSCQIPQSVANMLEKEDIAGQTLEDIADELLLSLYNMCMKKKSETPFAKCVYEAAKERDVVPPDPDWGNEAGHEEPPI